MPPESGQPVDPATVEIPAAGELREPPTVDLKGQTAPSDMLERSCTPAGEASRQVGDYELLGEIQRGGMGVVYRARERHSGRLVALKMMLEETVYGEADLQRFILEARATAELHHPGIVAIHAWGVHEGHPFYTMDFVTGEPLSRLLQSGPLPMERAARYLLGVARAVAAAHTQGIVHRDLKPSNIMIDATDQPRVLDFGLAKRRRAAREVVPAEAPPGSAGENVPGQGPKTERGAILGTPAYMSPEQARGEHQRVGPAADVHALGVIGYEMLAGQPPFQAETTMETLLQVVGRVPPPLRQRNKQMPAELDAILARCLAKDPADRFPDAGALAEELFRFWRATTQSGRFARLTLLAFSLVVVLSLLQLLSPETATGDRGWLFRLAAWTASGCGSAVQEAAELLAVLTGMFVFHFVPAVAWLALVVWLGAWCWYSGRGLIAGLLLAVGSGILWAAWPLVGGSPLFPALFSAAALVALLTPALHWWRAGQRGQQQQHSASQSDPYLQRLFAVRSEHSPKSGVRPGRSAIQKADVEPGKTLVRGKHCLLRWGKQRSLDRAVLIWLDTTPAAATTATPGVLVRHPRVLTLHAVGLCPEGRFLVTEPVAATPLAELLERQALGTREAIAITTSVARAVQAFHEQGACHGRLDAEWILLRGESEPLLCPCGFPSQAESDRQADIRAVARLLLEWLPPRPAGWQRSSLATVYRVAQAAEEGQYTSAADLASDLESASQIADARYVERLTNLGAGILYGLGLLVLAFFLSAPNVLGEEWTDTAATYFRHHVLVFLPSIVLLGYSHGRAVLHRLRHRLRIAARSAWLGRRTLQALLLLLILAMLPLVLACWTATGSHGLQSLWTTLIGQAILFGFWGLGVCFAAVRSFGELLFGSIRELRTDSDVERELEWKEAAPAE